MSRLESIIDVNIPSEVIYIETEIQDVSFQEAKLRDIQLKEIGQYALRIIYNGRVGTAFGKAEDDPKVVLESAKDLSAYGRKANFKMARGNRSCERFEYISPSLQHVSMAEIIDLGEYICRELQGFLPGWSIHCDFSIANGIKRILNSEGVNNALYAKQFRMDITLIRPREGDILELYSGRGYFPDSRQLNDVLSELKWHAEYSVKQAHITPGFYPLLLYPVATASFLTALQSSLDGKDVFEGLSPWAGRLGDLVLNPKITLVDDPIDVSLSSYAPFSDEGITRQAVTLIEAGRLQSYLTDIEYAQKLNLHCSGHGMKCPEFPFFDSLPAEPDITPSNLILSPGDVSLQDMMLHLDPGIFLFQTWDAWSGNQRNGDISGSVHLGYLVRRGRVLGRIKDMRVSGNIFSWLNEKLVALSKERPITMLGNFRIPYLLIDDVWIA